MDGTLEHFLFCLIDKFDSIASFLTKKTYFNEIVSSSSENWWQQPVFFDVLRTVHRHCFFWNCSRYNPLSPVGSSVPLELTVFGVLLNTSCIRSVRVFRGALAASEMYRELSTSTVFFGAVLDTTHASLLLRICYSNWQCCLIFFSEANKPSQKDSPLTTFFS